MNQSSNSAHSGILMTVALDAVGRSRCLSLSLSFSLRVKIVRATEERRRLVTFDVQEKKSALPPTLLRVTTQKKELVSKNLRKCLHLLLLN